MNKKLGFYFFVAATIVFVDRITKMMALAWCSEFPRVITSSLSFELVMNRGVAWSFFHSASDVGFLCVSLIIVVITALLAWYTYGRYTQGKLVFGEICIIAGSVSNIIDRVVYGGVIDFILLSYGDWSWPLFNCADVVIVCGVGIAMYQCEK